MKKIVAIAAFLCAASIWGFGQIDQPVRFGFQLSPTFNWTSSPSSRVNASGTNVGIKLGMMGEFYFAENYAFLSGLAISFNSGGTLLYDFGGSYWPEADLGTNNVDLPDKTKLKHNIQYLEIPVGLKFKTNEFGYIRYFFEPIFTFGFATQSRGLVNAPGSPIDPNEKFDIRNEVSTMNVSWGFGGGIEYAISETTSLIGGLAFSFGMVDVAKNNGKVNDPNRGEIDENFKETINSVTLMIGVMF